MGGLAESGVRATCFGGFTIVYMHRSTDWPVPYTDSHTSRAHEVIGRSEAVTPGQEGRGRKKERGGKEEGEEKKKEWRENEGGTIRGGDQRTAKAGGQTEVHFHSLRQVHSYYNDERTACRCSLARSPACPLSCQTLRLTGFSFSVPRRRRRRTSQSPSDIRLQTSTSLRSGSEERYHSRESDRRDRR